VKVARGGGCARCGPQLDAHECGAFAIACEHDIAVCLLNPASVASVISAALVYGEDIVDAKGDVLQLHVCRRLQELNAFSERTWNQLCFEEKFGHH
jgi:hypothetical protein